jgi:cytochrome c oxidase accessory protein FixG
MEKDVTILLKKQDDSYGDCIDCFACVRVCPTGIDIRNGTQLECINCTACMDACDAIMISINKPIGLIRYASENSIVNKQPLVINNRIKAYSAVLFLLLALLAVLLITRSDLDARLMRTAGMSYTSLPDGRISNLYNLKLANKTHKDIPVYLKLENLEGEIIMIENKKQVIKKEDYTAMQFFIKLNRNQVKGWKTPIIIGIYDTMGRIKSVKANFIGPEVYN